MTLAHPKGQVFGGKDTAQTFLLIDDQDTISPLCGTQLTGIRHSHVLRDSESRGRLQAGDSPFLRMSTGTLSWVRVVVRLRAQSIALGVGRGGRTWAFTGEL